jgi:hypothetical protein
MTRCHWFLWEQYNLSFFLLYLVNINAETSIDNIKCPVHPAYNPSFSACFFSQNNIFLSQQISQVFFSQLISTAKRGQRYGCRDIIIYTNTLKSNKPATTSLHSKIMPLSSDSHCCSCAGKSTSTWVIFLLILPPSTKKIQLQVVCHKK